MALTLTRSTILCLLFRGGPAAIARLVVTVIVDPINGVLRCWPASHIGKESFESSPSPAHFNSTASVPLPIKHMLIIATPFHYLPNSILGRVRSTMLESVCKPALFMFQAAATFCYSAQKITGKSDCSFSAITKTQPTRITKAAIFYTPDDANFHEAPATKVNEMAHMWSIA